MKITKPKYSKGEVSQKFNLKELLGYTPSDKQKEMFFNLTVDKIVQRTADGKDIDGKKFTKYSKDYAAKKGVPRTAVDLIDEGKMLGANQSTGKQKNIVKIQVRPGKETLKSFNHNVGDTLPTRNYFGIKSEKDLIGIIDQVDSIGEEKEDTSRGVGITDLAALRVAVGRDIDIEFGGFGDGNDQN